MVKGERDPQKLAAHRDHRCRHTVEEIARFLTGTWSEEHLFNLASTLRLFDNVEAEMATYQSELLKEIAKLQPADRATGPFRHTRMRRRKRRSASAGKKAPARRCGVCREST